MYIFYRVLTIVDHGILTKRLIVGHESKLLYLGIMNFKNVL